MTSHDKAQGKTSRRSVRSDGLSSIAPDFVAQEMAGEIDNIVPTHGYEELPMVGLGGSAGAIRPLQAFFESMPAHPGAAFVVVLHLSPHHHSLLADMIQKWTKMPVVQAEDGQKALADHVYVIPPGKHLTAANGHLKLADLDHEHGRRVAIDLFFRSLADTHGPHAAAVVLSGADGDGTLGVKRIKERGGLTIAQDPEEAEHDAMPRTAIGTGMIDWVLKAADMPRSIVDYIARESRLDLPPEDGPQPASPPRPGGREAEAAFHEILVYLRTRTRRDFSYYKRATILRRISRRMQVNGVDDLAAYLSFLRTNPGEAGALLKDLLISVTNFFRDREAFAALSARVPELFAGKGEHDAVRVWSPACATGEEAYSLAMLLMEHARTLDAPPAIQVFGCDLDDDAIQTARAGVYPDAITADVSEARLRAFFVKEHRGYRVRRELRELVLFATHDLLRDAPFSRIDLVACRNLLIYLNREAQARALEVFHFALRPEGLLFLGSSETVDDDAGLFQVEDKKNRIYRRRSAGRSALPLPTGPSSLLARKIEQQAAAERADASNSQAGAVASAPRPAAARERMSFGEVHFKLIERFGPPSVLVDADHEIHHLSESAGRFLRMSGGAPTTNLMRLVNPELRVELRALLFRAAHTKESAEAFLVPIDLDGQRRAVDIAVHPANDLAPGFLVVTFQLREESPASGAPASTGAAEPVMQHLERELEQMKLHLRDTVEQYEASTEELKASNEELQAMNEELRSATEELETSREELQSINEELTTVNQDSRNKLEELGQANSDLSNLMSATAIATLFLDRDMRVMRFTESAAPIFHLIPSDVGRPLHHLQHEVDYPDMASDAGRVLDKLTPVEREVTGAHGRSFLARMLPYRTHDDRIAGVVVTFVDISERERAKRELAEELTSTERLRAVSEQFAGEDSMQPLFEAMIDAAVSVAHADAGTVQLLDAENGALRLLASKGLPDALTKHFAIVDARSGTPCEAALASGKRSFVDFTVGKPETAESDRWHREVGGLRCGQNTPLMTRSGRPIGALSTFWKEYHEPTQRELRFLDLLARQAADAIERQLAADALRLQMDELSRFNEAIVGREARMVELKKEINALAARLGEKPRYSLEFESDQD